MKTKEEKIAKRRDDVSPMYREIYDRAMAGHSRKAAIKAFCLECMGWARTEVAGCDTYECPLHPYKPYTPKKLPEKRGVE